MSYFILVIFNISLLGFLFYIFTMGHFMATRESYIETAADYFVKFVTANMENDGQLIGTSKFFLRQNWEKMDYELIIYDRTNLIIADSRTLDEQMGIFSINSKGDEKVLSVLETGRPLSWKIKNDSSNFIYYCCPIFFETKIIGAVKIGMSTDDFSELFDIFKDYFIITFVLSLIAALGLAFIFVRSIMKPVIKIRDIASEISLGKFESRVNYDATDELGDLSRTINKMAEDLNKLEETRNLFLANISHELKTPLTIIKGFALTMEGDPEIREDQRHFLETINKEADRLTRLVNELLELSRLKTKKTKMNIAPFNIKEIIEDVVFNMQTKADKFHCTISCDCPNDLPLIPIDPDKIHEVFINLIDNAIKYSQNHKEKPEVKVIVEIDKQELIARVSDNGPGIPQADLDMIFEKFFRSGSSRSQKIEGVGLGLSIVKEIVNAHNGKIYAESKEGQGCTFVIKLPLQI